MDKVVYAFSFVAYIDKRMEEHEYRAREGKKRHGLGQHERGL